MTLLQSNLGRQSLLTQAYNTILQRDPTQPEIVLYLTQMKNENVLLRAISVTLLAIFRVLRPSDEPHVVVTQSPILRLFPDFPIFQR